ncbi:hypothetical protein K438DRAFT_1967502 [Mycena galopus ATCC 62051]|nr:hypothetical protein K438DRAFT_1967502 [Mycena galopus ATCC 62051]
MSDRSPARPWLPDRTAALTHLLPFDLGCPFAPHHLDILSTCSAIPLPQCHVTSGFAGLVLSTTMGEEDAQPRTHYQPSQGSPLPASYNWLLPRPGQPHIPLWNIPHWRTPDPPIDPTLLQTRGSHHDTPAVVTHSATVPTPESSQTQAPSSSSPTNLLSTAEPTSGGQVGNNSDDSDSPPLSGPIINHFNRTFATLMAARHEETKNMHKRLLLAQEDKEAATSALEEAQRSAIRQAEDVQQERDLQEEELKAQHLELDALKAKLALAEKRNAVR